MRDRESFSRLAASARAYRPAPYAAHLPRIDGRVDPTPTAQSLEHPGAILLLNTQMKAFGYPQIPGDAPGALRQALQKVRS